MAALFPCSLSRHKTKHNTLVCPNGSPFSVCESRFLKNTWISFPGYNFFGSRPLFEHLKIKESALVHPVSYHERFVHAAASAPYQDRQLEGNSPSRRPAALASHDEPTARGSSPNFNYKSQIQVPSALSRREREITSTKDSPSNYR